MRSGARWTNKEIDAAGQLLASKDVKPKLKAALYDQIADWEDHRIEQEDWKDSEERWRHYETLRALRRNRE